MSVYIHPTAVIESGVEIGDSSFLWDAVHVRRDTRIGHHCIIGEKTHVSYGVQIGNFVKINSFVYICTAVTLEDGVMISAGCIFTNDRYPRAANPEITALRESGPDEKTEATLVRTGATLGAGCIIGCGLTIGRFAMVGMGSLITRSVGGLSFDAGTSGPECRLCVPLRRAFRPLLTRLLPGSYYALLLHLPASLFRLPWVSYRVSQFPLMKGSQHWAIAGGGLLGMTLGWELSGLGHRVSILEASSTPGGLASVWQLGNIVWDRYYHVTLFSDLALRSLLKELDLDSEMRWSKTCTGFYSESTFYKFSGALDFARFPLLTPFEKVRFGLAIIRASRLKDPTSLDGLTVEAWLCQLSGRSVFEKIWRPLLRCKLGDDYRTTAATFMWATIQRLYAARRSGLKHELFGYLPGGYARMLKTFVAALRGKGVCFQLNSVVSEIRKVPNGDVEVTTADGSVQTFDRVILSVPAPLAASLCPQLNKNETDLLRGIEYHGIICTSVLLSRPLSEFYVTNIVDSSIALTGVIENVGAGEP